MLDNFSSNFDNPYYDHQVSDFHSENYQWLSFSMTMKQVTKGLIWFKSSNDGRSSSFN